MGITGGAAGSLVSAPPFAVTTSGILVAPAPARFVLGGSSPPLRAETSVVFEREPELPLDFLPLGGE